MKFNECLNWLMENKNNGKIKILKYQKYSNIKELFNKYLSEACMGEDECLYVSEKNCKNPGDSFNVYKNIFGMINDDKSKKYLIIINAHIFKDLYEVINLLVKDFKKLNRELDIVIISADGADYNKIKNHITAELECDSLESGVERLSKNALLEKRVYLFYKKPFDSVTEHNKEKMKIVIDALLKRMGKAISSPALAKELGTIDQKTIDKYIRILTEEQILTAVNRYDINKYSENGNNVISKMKKYYAVTKEQLHILFYAGIIDRKTHLENQALLKLKGDGFDVFAGKFGKTEIDFVTIRNSEICYFHIVTDSEMENEIIERYRKIKDNYPKIILTSEEFEGSRDKYGIIIRNITEWLKEETLSDK